MSTAEHTRGLGSAKPVAADAEAVGRETADSGAFEPSPLDPPRLEPWWSQLAALMQRSGGSR